jgi:hypothetical protein
MSSLSVLNNIDLIEKQISQLKNQQTEIEKELLRLDGSLRVFNQFKSVGIENIKLPKDIVENTEVLDTIENDDDGIPPVRYSDKSNESREDVRTIPVNM